MKLFSKVAVIGLDCALTHLIDKHIAEGELPNFKKLFENGTVCDNALVPYPTITPPNWATICTGAWPGTHGVTDFWVHVPGTTPTNNNAVCAFNTKWYQAETMWEAAERAGKKSVVFNYPGSWPSKMKDGIVVGGRGLAIGLVYDGHHALEKDIALCGDMFITTDLMYGTVQVKLHKADGWQSTGDMGDDPLEAEVVPNFPNSVSKFAPTTWYLLVRDMEGDGYDTVTLSPTKNMKDAFFTLKVGEWSPKVFTHIMADGESQEVFFNAKLIKLSEDAEELRLYMNPMVRVHGWANKPELDELIRDVPGIPGNSAGYGAYSFGWIDANTWVEINKQHAEYNAEVALRLLKYRDWDIFFMHSHPPDWAYHMFMSELDMQTAKSKESYELAWRLHREVYKAADEMLGRLMAAFPADTCICLVSDHGATMDGPAVDPNAMLESAGLMAYHHEEIDTRLETKTSAMVKKMFMSPDLSKSKAIAQRVCYVYVNLKSRYPEGIVEDKDYNAVQQEIIDALYAYRHPETGERVVSLALSREDARLIGLHGDGIGDVVYAVRPEYSSQHGNILPTASWGIGSLHALLTFTGPGIKKGQRLARTCNIVDLVPTLCYGGNFPIPEQCEGSVIYQAFEDPNFKNC